MQRHRTVFLAAAGLLVVFGVGVGAWSVRAETSALPHREPVQVIWVSPESSSQIVAGSARGLHVTQDGGKRWRRTSILGSAVVHDMARSGTFLYAATSKGLFVSGDGGIRWRLLFLGHSGDRLGSGREILAVAVSPRDPDLLLVGTSAGLAISRDRGLAWAEVRVRDSESAVSGLLVHPTQPTLIFAALESGLYRSEDDGKTWQRVLAQGREESIDGSFPELPEEYLDGIAPRGRQTVVADPAHPKRLYASLRRGIYQSDDTGTSWQPMPDAGIAGLIIHHLAVPHLAQDVLYAATSAGVYLYSGDWRAWRLLDGSPVCDVRFLVLDEGARLLWAATEQGLIKLPILSSREVSIDPSPAAVLQWPQEPSIGQVRQAAIRYAEVMPEKIRGWRTRATWAPWVPNFTVGIDRDKTTTIGSSSSGGRTNFTVGPEDRSIGVDFGFTWNLGELIWNPDQTSIDTRSRLMVQLRQDILDDVTRIYYERRRLQVEYQLDPVSDPMLQMERQLRLEELAAQLDALTDGQFTSPLKEENRVASTSISSQPVSVEDPVL